MKTRQYLIKIIWCAVIILSAVGCSTSEEVFDEDYVPTEEDIVETLKKVNTEYLFSCTVTNPQTLVDVDIDYYLPKNRIPDFCKFE